MRSEQTSMCDIHSAVGRPKNDRGFTMLEVILAISIFAVGILAVASMQLSAIKVNSSASKLTERVTLAQDRLEQLVALPYTSPWLDPAGNFPGLDTNNNTHQQAVAGGYTVTWNVTQDNPIIGCKRISVTVRRGTTSSTIVGLKSLM